MLSHILIVSYISYTHKHPATGGDKAPAEPWHLDSQQVPFDLAFGSAVFLQRHRLAVQG